MHIGFVHPEKEAKFDPLRIDSPVKVILKGVNPAGFDRLSDNTEFRWILHNAIRQANTTFIQSGFNLHGVRIELRKRGTGGLNDICSLLGNAVRVRYAAIEMPVAIPVHVRAGAGLKQPNSRPDNHYFLVIPQRDSVK